MKSTQRTLLSTRVFILIILDVHANNLLLQKFIRMCLLRKATCYTVLARVFRHAQAQK